MSENPKRFCPECDRDDPTFDVDRRDFMRIVSSQAIGLAALGSGAAGTLLAADSKADPAKGNKAAEDLIKELYATFTPEQKKEQVRPWDEGLGSDGKGVPTRNRIYNAALGKKIGDAYTKPQQELIDRILRAIASDEEGYQRITRNGHFDSSGSLQGCGATIFGDPEGKQFAYLFTSHHLTLRCDGNSVEGAAWGGPVYYGHSVEGYDPKNVFNYQTKAVQSVFDALSENQRKKAVITGNNPGEGLKSVEFRKAEAARPGVNYGELTQDQRKLVEGVMRDILSPFRKEDGDEVMQIIKATGGMEKISLAFYQDKEMNDNHRWHFWRLEGPGFVWNYRPLPHVHCYVNISSKIMG